MDGIPINRLTDSSGSPKSGGVGGDGSSNDQVEEELGYFPITQLMMNAAEQAEEFAISIWHKFQSWKVIHFSHLPQVVLHAIVEILIKHKFYVRINH